jgi:hypothetical protein
MTKLQLVITQEKKQRLRRSQYVRTKRTGNCHLFPISSADAAERRAQCQLLPNDYEKHRSRAIGIGCSLLVSLA